jgi:hypothetical protein
MATTTPNYGWTVPTSTDLVKDGATAIETLGDAIDASMNTALGTKKAGMVLLNTTSFTGVASQQINSVFSSAYDNYKIEFSMPTASTAGSISARFCTGGTPNSTSNYNNVTWAFRSGNGQLVDTANENANTSSIMSAIGNGNAITLNLFNPFSATHQTYMTGTGLNVSGSAGYICVAMIHGTRFNGTTSFDGIQFNFGANNQTGQISIYGVNK